MQNIYDTTFCRSICGNNSGHLKYILQQITSRPLSKTSTVGGVNVFFFFELVPEMHQFSIFLAPSAHISCQYVCFKIIYIFFFYWISFLSSFCCPHQEAHGASLLKRPQFWCWKALRMREHVLQHRAWWGKQTLHHVRHTSALGQTGMWTTAFPVFNYSLFNFQWVYGVLLLFRECCAASLCKSKWNKCTFLHTRRFAVWVQWNI